MSANTMNTGLWTDWEKGRFMGWTLTWGTREAGILSSQFYGNDELSCC